MRQYLARGRMINSSEAGTGKTLPTLIYLARQPGTKVVIAPAFLKRNWLAEAEKFNIHLTDTHFLSHHQVREGQLPPTCNTLVIDECHLAFSAVTGKQKTLKSLLGWLQKTNPHYRFLLSGTPMKNHVGELYPLLKILGEAKGYNYWGWLESFAKLEPIYPGATTKKVVGISNPNGLKAYLAPFVWGVKSKDVIRLDPLNEQFVYVEVPAKLDKELKPFLTDEQLELAGSKAKGIQVKRALAIAKAGALGKEGLLDTLDPKAPLLVFTDHPDSIKIIRDRLAKDRKVDCITAEVPSSHRQTICQRFQDGEVDCLVCSIPCSGVGLNLQRAQYIIFNDLSWSAAANEQALARANRKGRQGLLSVYYLIGGEHDEHLSKLLTAKIMAFQEVFG